jgi:hypothetical protein
MGLPNEIITGLIGSSGYSGYEIGNSAVFDGSTDYLTFTPSSTGNRKKWTTSFWVKRHALGETTYLYTCAAVSGNDGIAALYFNASDELVTYYDTSGANPVGPVNSRKYRDVGAWYHIIWAVDAVNTVHRIWVNGVEETANASYYPPNFDYGMNYASHAMAIGSQAWNLGGNYADVSVAELHHLDGQYITDPTNFGEFYQGGNKWRPIQPSGLTYGTNGFYLPFTQDTPNLGTDYSGNGNDWTENGSPTQSGDSPTVNYCTWSPLDKSGSPTFTDGNLHCNESATGDASRGTISINSGKWYFEATYTQSGAIDGTAIIGFQSSDEAIDTSSSIATVGSKTYVYRDDGYTINNGAGAGGFTNYGDGDIIMVAFDADNKKIWFGVNGTWENSGDPGAGTGEQFSSVTTDALAPYAGFQFNQGTNAFTANFGQTAFSYTAPTGFNELTAANLPDPTITDPGEYFNVVLYSGTGAPLSITGGGFQPDLVWAKRTDSSQSHRLADAIRGSSVLFTDTTAAEDTTAGISFDSDGFSWTNSDGSNANDSGGSYVSWNWKAGGAGVPNTDGTISSTVSVNDDAGFSIVGYTGTGSAGTVGHGLSEAPEFVVAKRLNVANGWYVQHKDLLTTSNQYLELNTSNSIQTSSGVWNGIEATSSAVSLGNNNATNGSGDEYIMYCFRSIPGFSKVFSFEGNGSSDGIFVYLGFRPKFILYRNADQTGNGWPIWDDVRSPYNGRTKYFTANSNNAENDLATREIDFLSNGFKTRGTSTEVNRSGNTFVGIAFAENPFGGSNLPLGLAQ